jgi:hypothetical protein
MEDYVWILVLLAIWLFEITGKALKKKGGPPGGAEVGASRPDPRTSVQELSRDVDASARRAEEALLRWEQKQLEVAPVTVPAVVGRRSDGTTSRRDAFEAIAGMLAAPRQERMIPPPRLTRAMEAPSRLATDKPWRLPAVAPVAELPPPATVRSHTRRGIGRLVGLPELQRAVVLREILGPPVSLVRPGSGESRPDWD